MLYVFGGSGSGTADTERNESHNACMMKAVVDNGKHDFDFFTEEVIAFFVIFLARAFNNILAAITVPDTTAIYLTPQYYRWI